jgi:hypothetical protein
VPLPLFSRVVDEVMRTEPAGERLFVATACDRDGAEAELVCELHPEMAETADTQDGNHGRIARARPVVADAALAALDSIGSSRAVKIAAASRQSLPRSATSSPP